MPKIANSYYSIAHPKVFRQDGQRVTNQILSCLKYVSPLAFKKCRAIDIGGSNGLISYYLSRQLQYIISIDTDKEAVQFGRKRYHSRNLLIKSFTGTKIPYPDNSFDLIIYRRTYGSIDRKGEMSEEILRILKPGGMVYFEGHNRLFFIETDNFIPFLTILPDLWVKKIFTIKRQSPYYVERYSSFWGVKKLFSQFEVHMLTAKIIQNPQKFKFRRLYKIGPLTKFIPLFILKALEPLYPDFIWVLRKRG